MANHIATSDSNLCEYLDMTAKCKYYAGENRKLCDDCIKQYFENKVKGKEKMRKFEKVERLKNINFKLPERKTKGSAGYDFECLEDVYIPPYKLGDNPTLVPTGVKCLMEDDEFLMLVNRSSNPKKKKLVIPNSMGIIDADYYNNPDNEGEMMFAFYNLSTEPILIEKGYALGQGIFIKYGKTYDDKVEMQRVGGFGSTSKQKRR